MSRPTDIITKAALGGVAVDWLLAVLFGHRCSVAVALSVGVALAIVEAARRNAAAVRRRA